MDTRLRTAVLGMVVAATITAACGSNAATDDDAPSATSTPSSTASVAASTEPAASAGAETPEGWERFEIADGAFAISLPREWEAADLSSGDIEQIVEFLEADPATAPIAPQIATLFEQGVVFFAVSVDAAGLAAGVATNVNILVQPDIGGMSLDPYAAANISFLETTLSLEVEREDVTLPIGDAVRIDYDNTQQGSAPVHQTQFYLVDDGRGIIATFTRAAGDEFADLDAEFAQIMETMELLP